MESEGIDIGILSSLALLLTIVLLLVFFLERRTMWVGLLFLLWVMIASGYLILTIESYERTVALIAAFILAAVTVVGFPFYLLSFIWLLISSGRQLIKREGKRLRNFLSLAFGVFLIVWLVASPFFVTTIEHPLAFTVISIITVSVYYFFFLMALFALSSMLNRVRIPFKTYDYIIVLGSGLIGDKVPPLLASRIDKGIDLFIRHHTKERPVKVIFTGGQGSDEKLPEGVAMASYAMQQGLRQEHIIVEDQAINTYENLLFSAQLIEAERQAQGKNSKYNVITVTNNFHVFRALLWARKVGVKSDGAGSKTKFYFWLNALIREFIGVVYMQKKFHIAILAFSYLLILAFVLINQYFVVPYLP